MFPEFFRDDVFRLETQRLWLRWPTAADAPAIEALAGEADVACWTAHIPHPYPAGGGHQFVTQARVGNHSGGGLTLALATRARPQSLIGVISLAPHDRGMELGYWLGKPFWGQGLMSEAARELTSFIWLTTDVERIFARVMIGNGRSEGVLTAAGFRPEGAQTCPAPARGASVAADGFVLERPEEVTFTLASIAMTAAAAVRCQG
jgi:RimJ/RimL family protein N-acetyltransferase